MILEFDSYDQKSSYNRYQWKTAYWNSIYSKQIQLQSQTIKES